MPSHNRDPTMTTTDPPYLKLPFYHDRANTERYLANPWYVNPSNMSQILCDNYLVMVLPHPELAMHYVRLHNRDLGVPPHATAAPKPINVVVSPHLTYVLVKGFNHLTNAPLHTLCGTSYNSVCPTSIMPFKHADTCIHCTDLIRTEANNLDREDAAFPEPPGDDR